MKSLVAFLCLVGVVCASRLAVYEFVEEWELWKGEHGKTYHSELDELEKHLVWLSNKKYIEQHNSNSHIFGFTLAMNHFGDMTDTEFMEQYSTYQYDRMADKQGNYTKVFEATSGVTYADSIDWRTKGAVTGIKNQDQCGASYAFSAIGALEGAVSLARSKLVSLSEQNIIDCSVAYGNHGCQGGNMYNAYMYAISNNGIDTSQGYPFGGYQSSCSFSSSCVGAQISGSVRIKSGDESSLQAAVATAGPVAVAVDGSNKAFRYYQYGVYDMSQCSSSKLTHAMVITGYGSTSAGKDYWLVKNSWGYNWGLSGYILMARNRYNQCGIATDASYPTL